MKLKSRFVCGLLLLLSFVSLALVPSQGAATVSGKITRTDFPSSIAFKEVFTVTVSVDYSNMPLDGKHTLQNVIEFSDYGVGSDQTKWESDDNFWPTEATGRHTFESTNQLMPPAGYLTATTWNLKMAISVFSYNIITYDKAELDSKDYVLGVLNKEPTLTIKDLTYVKPPDTVRASETTPILATAQYSGLYKPMTITLDIFDTSTGANVGYQSSAQMLSGDGTYTFRPIDITAPPMGIEQWKLRVELTAETTNDVLHTPETVATDTREIAITVEPPPKYAPQVKITTIDYPTPSITVGEISVVSTTVQYSNITDSSALKLWYEDVETGKGLTPYSYSTFLKGSGVYKFSPANLENPSSTAPRSWKIRANVGLAQTDEPVASKEFTISIVLPEGKPNAEITDLEYPKPPQTVAYGENAVFVVTVKYVNMPPTGKLLATIWEPSTHVTLREVASTQLQGSGTYTFPDIICVMWTTGERELELKISDDYSSQTYTSERFKITVVAAGGPAEKTPSTITITKLDYVKPPDTIRVGESTFIKVTIQYQSLMANTKLQAYAYDDDAGKKTVGSASSPSLSGSGTYTFTMPVKPTKSGQWHLTVGIQEYKSTQLKITITVVK